MTDHAAFMNALAEDAFVRFAGPVAGTEHARLRVLLAVDAQCEAEIHRRLANDPWARSELLRIASIEPWDIILGAERLS